MVSISDMEMHLSIYRFQISPPESEVMNGHVLWVYFTHCKKKISETLRFLNIPIAKRDKVRKLLSETDKIRSFIKSLGDKFDVILEKKFMPR